MRPTLLATVIAVGGLALAHHDEHGKENVKVLSQKEITEKLDGKQAKATTVEVTLGPGQASAPHRHPGPAFGYVLEGEYEHALNDEPVTTYKAGDTFYEPSGCVHRVTRNPSKTANTRLLAVILHPRDAKELVILEKTKH
jgi:quercetin dioxygenase-like cupin family protein